MQKEIEIILLPDEKGNEEIIKSKICSQLHINSEELFGFIKQKESLDARKIPVFRIKYLVFINEKVIPNQIKFNFKNVEKSEEVIIVGSGPAGLFAAIKLIELGKKPVIFERGKNVRERRFDLKEIMQNGNVNENSNYCFGEGGAGTYSDGKLYTRSNKRGNVNRILDILIYHGAKEEIRYEAHPHIGSNKLPKIIEKMRETIQKYGGEIHFNSKVTDIIVRDSQFIGVEINKSEIRHAKSVILATGHSARDIYYLLDKRKIQLEPKSFAVGVRIEHPQELIDAIQYKIPIRPLNLPAASYSLVNNVNNKGIFSFCMCPGGIIIPASTNSNELVLNGMSVSKRNSPFANSGIVVSVDENDWSGFKQSKHFAGLKFQEWLEKKSFEIGGGKLVAPAQRITDFVQGKVSTSLPKTSYYPGILTYDISKIFSKVISKSLALSIMEFEKKMKGFYTSEAVILASETRTSSPIRIPRHKENMMHINIVGLFPAGEGAGYAGGIVSAAIDGENSAEAVVKFLSKN